MKEQRLFPVGRKSVIAPELVIRDYVLDVLKEEGGAKPGRNIVNGAPVEGFPLRGIPLRKGYPRQRNIHRLHGDGIGVTDHSAKQPFRLFESPLPSQSLPCKVDRERVMPAAEKLKDLARGDDRDDIPVQVEQAQGGAVQIRPATELQPAEVKGLLVLIFVPVEERELVEDVFVRRIPCQHPEKVVHGFPPLCIPHYPCELGAVFAAANSGVIVPHNAPGVPLDDLLESVAPFPPFGLRNGDFSQSDPRGD